MRALVVDDNATFRRQTASYLGLHDIDVDTADRGKEALRALHGHAYDVVLLDLKMPDMHGLDVLRQAKADDISVPIIVVTGYGDVSSAVEAMKTGAVDFIEKPFDPERLLTLVRETATSHFGAQTGRMKLESLLTGDDLAVLLIAEQPERLEHMLSFTADEHLSLADGDIMLDDLQTAIAAFTDGHDRPVVVHAGLASLFQRTDGDAMQRYLAFLHRCADSSDARLLVLYGRSLEQDVMDHIVDDTDAAIYVGDAIAMLDHSIRRDVLYLLERNAVLPYSFFLKHMDIDHSAKLAFHLNRLQESNLVEKTEEGYTLTERGHSFAMLYQSMLMQRQQDMHDNILYYPLSMDNDEAGGGI